MSPNLSAVFAGKKVFITGHTGFKGAWLTLWLKMLGADIIGYSLSPPTTPNLYDIAAIENEIFSLRGDIRDFEKLEASIKKEKPHLVLHLAAQSLVLPSFANPQETFATNAMGTVNILEACRGKKEIQALLIITTDKCYENKEWLWGYRENDPLGGNDPYSASKAMAELAALSYRASFREGPPIATARAGNVVGGGDFSPYRLIPDCMKALIKNKPIEVRNPKSTRPWLYVLDALYGYLVLASKLLQEGIGYGEAWNFGPIERDGITTEKVVEEVIEQWGEGDWIDSSVPGTKKEKGSLKLNWDKAAERLNFQPLFRWDEAIKETVCWFQHYLKNPSSSNMKQLSLDFIARFMEKIQCSINKQRIPA